MQRTLFDEITRTKGDERISARPRRAAIVPVRLTEGERDQLAEVARDLGISLSTYMRQVVLSRPLPPRRRCVPYPRSTARPTTPWGGSRPTSMPSPDAWPSAVVNLGRPRFLKLS